MRGPDVVAAFSYSSFLNEVFTGQFFLPLVSTCGCGAIYFILGIIFILL